MLTNAFAGQAKRPTKVQLASTLGETHVLWQGLVSALKSDLKLDSEEWNSYSVKAGWSLRLKLKKRNIVYLAPAAGGFRVAFVLGDKAMAAARKSNLPKNVLKIISHAKRYPEGSAVRLEVYVPGDIEPVKVLAKIKMES